MPWYQVLVTREASESTTVTVEADSPEQAEELALEEAETVDGDDWALDDGNSHEPYICDPGNCATECEAPEEKNDDTETESSNPGGTAA